MDCWLTSFIYQSIPNDSHVPEQQWYTHPLFSVALGGILPFGAVCIELFFIMSALWLHQIYYVFVRLWGVFC